MNAKKLGDLPASPYTCDMEPQGIATYRGLTLRQHFAGQIMASVIGSADVQRAVAEVANDSGMDPGKTVAAYAVECADALLTELAKEQP